MSISRIAGALCALLITFFPAANGESLLDVYELAVQSDPLVREAEANFMATAEAKPQARSALLPQISLSGSRGDNGSDGLSSFVDFLPDGTPVQVSTQQKSDSNSTSFRLELRQTLFQWDRWIALKQADKVLTQANTDFLAARQDLMVRVALRYFDVLTAQDQLEAEQGNREAIARQLEQAEKRFEVGLIAITDVQEAQAAYDQAIAADIAARRILATARESLREITGSLIETLNRPSKEMELVPPSPADPDQWVRRALDQNLALVASRLGADIARDEIRSRRAGHLPTLELVANRSEFDQTREQVSPNNAGVLISSTSEIDQSSDSVSLQLNLPLFSGGFTTSRVREAVYQHRAAKERVERIARATERQTRDAYLGVLSEISRVNALAKALESATTALRATEAGFEVGTRTTVDVLDSRRNLINARTNYLTARYVYILNVLSLKQATGALSEEDLARFDRWMTP